MQKPEVASYISMAEVFAAGLSVPFCVWYFLKKHWLANNVLGLAFAIQGIENISLGSTVNGCILLTGLFFCVLTGCSTPVFSFLVAQLLAALVPGSGVDLVEISLLVLLVSAIDGLAQCLRYTLMQASAMRWVTAMREQAFGKVVAQDKSWFDRPANTPVALLTTIVKDAEDARNVLGVIIPQVIVVVCCRLA